MASFNDIKKFVGKPWSSIEKLLDSLKEEKEDQSENNGAINLDPQYLPIFGHCPAADTFQLALCSICGNKFKIPMLLDHIKSKHHNDNLEHNSCNQESTNRNSVNNHDEAKSNKNTSSKKSSQKNCKEKMSNAFRKTQITSNKSTDKNTQAICQNNQPLQFQVHLDRNKLSCTENEMNKNPNNTSKLPNILHGQKFKQIRVKLKRVDVTDLSNGLVGNSSPLQDEILSKIPTKINKALNNSQSVINNNTNKSIQPIKSKDKFKDIAEIPRKHYLCQELMNNAGVDKVPQAVSGSAKEQFDKNRNENIKIPELEQINIQKKPLTSLTIHKDDRKRQVSKSNERKSLTSGRDRIYNPDRHCGVIIKDTQKNCMRSLTCKTHSILLRRAVSRSKTFDELLLEHRKERESSRNFTPLDNNIPIPQLIMPQQNRAVEVKIELDDEDINKSYVQNHVPNDSKQNKNLQDKKAINVLKHPNINVLTDITPKLVEAVALDEEKSTPITTNNPKNNLILSLIQPPFAPRTTNFLRSDDIDSMSSSNVQNKTNKNGQFCGYQQWHPLWRRNQGLLYTTMRQVPRVPPSLIPINTGPGLTVNQSSPPYSSSLLTQDVENLASNLFKSNIEDGDTTAKYLDYLNRHGLLLKENAPTKRILKPNIAINCKRMKTQNGEVCVIGPLISNSRLKTGKPVYQISLNSIIGKNVTSIQTPSTPTILSTTPFNNGHEGVHYVSASGPIPLALTQANVVSQVT